MVGRYLSRRGKTGLEAILEGDNNFAAKLDTHFTPFSNE